MTISINILNEIALFLVFIKVLTCLFIAKNGYKIDYLELFQGILINK